MLLKNILGEPWNQLSIILVDATNLGEVLTPRAVFLGEPLTQKKENWRTLDLVVNPSRRFVETLRRFVLYETRQYFNRLSKIEGPSLKLKSRSGPVQAQINPLKLKKTVKISCACPFKRVVVAGVAGLVSMYLHDIICDLPLHTG